jgi:predicted nucleotidyltransferase
MRISDNLKKQLLKLFYESFGDVEIILFGSRVDDSKRGGDFDFAIKGISKEEFKKNKLKFLKLLLLNDLDDLPIDLVHFDTANELLKKEIINKGIKL